MPLAYRARRVPHAILRRRRRGGADGEDLASRHRYLASLGIAESSIVDFEYFDYACSKYLALGMPDTMPRKCVDTEKPLHPHPAGRIRRFHSTAITTNNPQQTHENPLKTP